MVWSLPTTVKTVIPTGSAFLAQQVIEPLPLSMMERMGTVGVVAVGSYYLVKYFMAQLEKKDLQIKEHVDTMKTLHADSIELLVTELRESRNGRERLSETLAQWTRSNEQLTREVMNVAKGDK
jgi:hypothetical protein